MKKVLVRLVIIFVVIFSLSACSTSFESFNLERTTNLESEFEYPQVFMVAPEINNKEVAIYYRDSIEHFDSNRIQVKPLEEVIITDTNIIIKTIDETFTFERTSEFVVVGENDIEYNLVYPEDN